MRATVDQVVKAIASSIPEYSAEDWDNVGLQVGAPDAPVESVLVCLDVSDAVIDEAVERNCKMIISHHPLIFRPLKTLCEADPKGRLVSRLIKSDIALYVMHTNYDHYQYGLSDLLAKALSLQDIAPLIDVMPQKLYKYVVYVPTDAYQAVANAAFAAGAGQIGGYSECGYAVAGEGSFKPLKGSNPAIGSIGKREYVAEMRFETLVLETHLSAVRQAVYAAHPYEEVAADIIELQQKHYPFALGKRGRLRAPLSAEAFAAHLKESLSLQSVRLAGDTTKTISTVAVISGAGMDFIGDVARFGVDAYVTGDAKYHEVVDSLHYGLLLADVGHFESEVIFADGFAKQLAQIAERHGLAIEALAATVEKAPFKYY